jgi:hypothetical protein
MRFRAGQTLAVLILLILPLQAPCRTPSPSRKMALVFEVGDWQPQILNDELRLSTFGECGATPRLGAGLSFPLGKDLGFRVAGGFWSLRKADAKRALLEPLSLHSVSADFKYWLVPDFRLSAYVLYGGTVYWGLADETRPFGPGLDSAEPSWGADLGAGFDLALTDHLGAGMVFQYRFVRLREALGGLADFSGPDIGAAIYLFL